MAWFDDILSGLGAPNTPNNVQKLAAWNACEGNKAGASGLPINNPFNTTLNFGGGVSVNSAGVKFYPSLPIGIQATLNTLGSHYYTAIVANLRADGPGSEFAGAVGAAPWGTSGVCIGRNLGVAPAAGGGGPSPAGGGTTGGHAPDATQNDSGQNDLFANAFNLTAPEPRKVYSVTGLLTGSTLEPGEVEDPRFAWTFVTGPEFTTPGVVEDLGTNPFGVEQGSIWYRFVVPPGTQGVFRWSVSLQDCSPPTDSVGSVGTILLRVHPDDPSMSGLVMLYRDDPCCHAYHWNPLILNCEGQVQGNSSGGLAGVVPGSGPDLTYGGAGFCYSVRDGETYYLRLSYGDAGGDPGGIIVNWEYDSIAYEPAGYTDSVEFPTCTGSPLATVGLEFRVYQIFDACPVGSGVEDAFLVQELIVDEQDWEQRFFVMNYGGPGAGVPNYYGSMSIGQAFRSQSRGDYEFFGDNGGSGNLVSNTSGVIRAEYVAHTAAPGENTLSQAAVEGGQHNSFGFRTVAPPGGPTTGWAHDALVTVSGDPELWDLYSLGGSVVEWAGCDVLGVQWGGPDQTTFIALQKGDGTTFRPLTLWVDVDGNLLQMWDWTEPTLHSAGAHYNGWAPLVHPVLDAPTGRWLVGVQMLPSVWYPATFCADIFFFSIDGEYGATAINAGPGGTESTGILELGPPLDRILGILSPSGIGFGQASIVFVGLSDGTVVPYGQIVSLVDFQWDGDQEFWAVPRRARILTNLDTEPLVSAPADMAAGFNAPPRTIMGLSHDGTKLYVSISYGKRFVGTDIVNDIGPLFWRDWVAALLSIDLDTGVCVEEWRLEHPFHDTNGFHDTTVGPDCTPVAVKAPRGKLTFGPQTMRPRVPAQSTNLNPNSITLAPSESGVPSTGGSFTVGPTSVRPR